MRWHETFARYVFLRKHVIPGLLQHRRVLVLHRVSFAQPKKKRQA